MTDQPSEAAAKVDPETLVLRSRPGRAIRFKRGAIVSMAAIAATGIVGTAWFALQPHALRLAAQADDSTTVSKVPTDVLSKLPTSYGAAPKLGPPLPGDLGKPILDRQRALAAPPMATEGARPANTAEAERQRRLEELKAARQSGLMFSTADRTGSVVGTVATTATAPTPAATAEPAGKLALDPDRDPNGQQRKTDFVAATDKGGDV